MDLNKDLKNILKFIETYSRFLLNKELHILYIEL